MLHPETTLKFINPEVGVGVFAMSFIPAGTIMDVEDLLQIEIRADSPLHSNPLYKDLIKKYAYTDPSGTLILSSDLGKYVNHCCQCNIMTTGFEFDIAIRDIWPGEEITTEYGLFCFHPEEEINLLCAHFNYCRKRIKLDDIDQYSAQWDEQVKAALKLLPTVPQLLLPYLDPETRNLLNVYLESGQGYPSVHSLKHKLATS